MGDEDATLGNQSPDQGNDDIPSSAREALGDGAASDAPLQTNEPAPSGEPDEPQDNRERTKLGRRVSEFETEIQSLKQTISQLQTTLTERIEPSARAMDTPVDDKPPVDYITTPEDLEKYERWRENKLAERKNAYANKYIHSIKTSSYLSPDMHAEIENELLTNVDEYPTYSKFTDPAGDAQKNYIRAENKLLKLKLAGAKPQPNVRGEKPVGTGVSVNSRTNNPVKAPVKLDEYASKFVRHIGEAEDSEWVQKSVSGER